MKSSDDVCCVDFLYCEEIEWVFDNIEPYAGRKWENKPFNGWSMISTYRGYPGAEHMLSIKQIFYCPFCGAKL